MATLTVYPDPHIETSTVDGEVQRHGVNETWANIRTGAGTSFIDDQELGLPIHIAASATINQWTRLRRSIFLYDTSSLGAEVNISNTVMSLYGYPNKYDGLGITPDIDIYTSTPTSNTALANADYGQVQAISQTGSPISYASWNNTAYNDFTFNATGRGNVSKTGISKFGARNANYDVSGTDPAWTSGGDSYLYCYFAERANTTQDPKLVVTYEIVYTLSAESGSFTETGQAVGLLKSNLINAETTGCSITGQDASLYKLYELVAASGTFIETGQAVTFIRSTVVSCLAGTYNLTGTVAALLASRSLVPASGVYLIQGTDASLGQVKTLSAAGGSYLLTGQPISFLTSRVVVGEVGSFILIGYDTKQQPYTEVTISPGVFTESTVQHIHFTDVKIGV